jgi:hypothetical protein
MFRFLLTVFVLVSIWRACTFVHRLPIMRSPFLVSEKIICTSDFLYVVCRDGYFMASFMWDWCCRETVMGILAPARPLK